MKIMIEQSLSRIGLGIASSLALVPEFHVSFWDVDAKPAMDMFDEFKPDLVFVSPSILGNEDFSIASSRYPNVAVICVGNVKDNLISPALSINSDSSEFPNIDFEEGVMLGKIGRPQYDEALSSDVLCLTDYVQETKENTNILEFLSSSYNTKIFGNGHFNVPSYLGIVSDQQRANALASTKVVVDLDGGSSYDAMWLGKHVITSPSSILQLKKDIDNLIEEEENVIGKIRVKNKTYFDLCSQVLAFLGLRNESNFLMEKKREASV